MAKKPANRKAGVKESPMPAKEADEAGKAEERETWTERPSFEGDPSPGADRSQRARRFRLAAWVALLMAAVVVGISVLWVTGPPTEAELRKRAGLFGKERLKIGVKSDTPGIALQEENGNRDFKGFDIEIAYMIAADLGYPREKVDLLAIETEDRVRMQAQDGSKVDLVVATFSKTSERETASSNGLSVPYLETEQSVVTRSDYRGDVTSLGQLKGKRVCTLGTSTSQKKLEEATKAAEITPKNLIRDCMTGLLEKEEFDAVTTDAALLAGFVKESDGKLRHHDIALENREMWVVNVGPNAALRTLVDLALYRSYADPKDRKWEDAYTEHIKPLLLSNLGRDHRPISVAAAEQPCVAPPEVRRWPWERSLPARECLS